MPSPVTLISVEEYLRTSYQDGDREYVDGVVVERNLGEKPHSRMQRQLIIWFSLHEKTLGTFCFPEQRVQVKPARFRVPDVCVYIGREPDENIFTTPPFLVVEILSADDRARELQDKIDDYLSFGVPFVWVIDPVAKRGYIHTRDGSLEARDGSLRTTNPEIAVTLSELFE
jgi:Uma2 family endonuclease